jgi:hypothetical protein
MGSTKEAGPVLVPVACRVCQNTFLPQAMNFININFASKVKYNFITKPGRF